MTSGRFGISSRYQTARFRRVDTSSPSAVVPRRIHAGSPSEVCRQLAAQRRQLGDPLCAFQANNLDGVHE